MSASYAPVPASFVRPATPGTAVIVGPFATVAKVVHIADAFRSLGWDVVEVEMSRHLSSPEPRQLHRLIDRFIPHSKIEGLAAAIEDEVARTNADVVLFAKAAGATAQLLDRLYRRGCRTICWYPDRDFEHPFVDAASLPLFDLVLTTKSYQLDYLTSLRSPRPTIQVDHGYCPGVHRRLDPAIEPEDRPFDLVFIGNHSTYKQDWIEAILANLPPLRVAIAGNRWSRIAANGSAIFPSGGPLTGDLMSRTINHARICLALHHGPGGSHGWSDAISARSFETPACGTFMLHIDSPDIRRLFEIGEEIDVFDDPVEAAEKISYYLAHPGQREVMAERAWRRATDQYSYQHRGRDIAAYAAKLLQGTF